MKRLCERIDGKGSGLSDSAFYKWKDGIRNTGENLGPLSFPLNYYIIANDNILR